MKKMFQKPVVYIIQAFFCFGMLLVMYLFGRQQKTIDINADEICSQIFAERSLYAEAVTEGDALSLRALYGLNANDFADFAFYEPASNMNVDELCVIHMSDSGQFSEINDAFSDRLSDQTEKFKNYGEEEMQLINHAKCVKYGDYCICIIADDPEGVLSDFKKIVKGK